LSLGHFLPSALLDKVMANLCEGIEDVDDVEDEDPLSFCDDSGLHGQSRW